MPLSSGTRFLKFRGMPSGSIICVLTASVCPKLASIISITKDGAMAALAASAAKYEIVEREAPNQIERVEYALLHACRMSRSGYASQRNVERLVDPG